jgi:protein arginine kinase activator
MSDDHGGASFQRKCSICGKEDVLVVFKIIRGGIIEEKGLCAKCALKYLKVAGEELKVIGVDEKLIESLSYVRELLGQIAGNIESIAKASSNNIGEKVYCKNCGISFDSFIETGYLGCPFCYSSFRSKIIESIKEFQRASYHRGKMPPRFSDIYLIRKEIIHLRNQLKRLVLSENYEEAEKIKKKLEKLIGFYPITHEDELY